MARVVSTQMHASCSFTGGRGCRWAERGRVHVRLIHTSFHSQAWEAARTVVAPPSSVVKCVWGVFVWGFWGVVLVVCVCVDVGGVVLCVCVCVTCWSFYTSFAFTGGRGCHRAKWCRAHIRLCRHPRLGGAHFLWSDSARAASAAGEESSASHGWYSRGDDHASNGPTAFLTRLYIYIYIVYTVSYLFVYPFVSLEWPCSSFLRSRVGGRGVTQSIFTRWWSS